MTFSDASFRKAAYRLIDILKRPENTDILEAFKTYDASQEDGWGNFEAIPPELLKLFNRQGFRPASHLTVEQTARWNAITDEADLPSSGSAFSMTLLIAQGMLGRTDVYDEGRWES